MQDLTSVITQVALKVVGDGRMLSLLQAAAFLNKANHAKALLEHG